MLWFLTFSNLDQTLIDRPMPLKLPSNSLSMLASRLHQSVDLLNFLSPLVDFFYDYFLRSTLKCIRY